MLSLPYKVTNGYQQTGGMSFKIPEETNKWKITVTFTSAITEIVVYDGENENCVGNTCTFENIKWNGFQTKDSEISLKFHIDYEAESINDVISIKFNGHDVCSSEKIEKEISRPSSKGIYKCTLEYPINKLLGINMLAVNKVPIHHCQLISDKSLLKGKWV